MPEQLYKKKSECCGCEACANVCPKGIIKMEADAEGFLYPRITNETECINCNRCLHVCPIKHWNENASPFINYYAGSSINRSEVTSSASGGLATAISKQFVANGGVVYGVQYDENYMLIQFERADKIAEIDRFKTSKYAQAIKGNIYKQIKGDLSKGRPVLFIGLPCEVFAVKRYVGDHNQLYTAELVCHGPTSQLVHKKYCRELEEKYKSNLVRFSTRHKLNGKWKPYYVYAAFANGKTFQVPFHQSEYGIAFRYLKRPSCNECPFKSPYLYSDVMLGDFHIAGPGNPVYDEHGVSVALVHTNKGEELLKSLVGTFNLQRVDARSALVNEAINSPIRKKIARGGFSKRLVHQGLGSACDYYGVHISDALNSGKKKLLTRAALLKRKIKGK